MASIESQTVNGGGGLALHVEETGNRGGKPILFLHGLSQCRLSWNKQLHSELARDFRLVAMDLRGHGRSEKPRDVYDDSRLWADDVHAVIRALGLDRPVLVGSSYGGIVISDYVQHYGEDGIAGTNWVGAISRLGESIIESGFIAADFLAAAPAFFSENVEESAAALERLIRLSFPREPAPEDLYFFLGFNIIVPPHVRQGLFSRSLNHDPVVERMRKPMLLSYGKRDAVVSVGMGEHLARLAPHAKLSIYQSAGHVPFWQAPTRFNRELRELRESA